MRTIHRPLRLIAAFAAGLLVLAGPAMPASSAPSPAPAATPVAGGPNLAAGKIATASSSGS